MTVQDLKSRLEDFPEDMPVLFLLEQAHINLQYDITDERVLTDERAGQDGEECLYLLGSNENYGPKAD